MNALIDGCIGINSPRNSLDVGAVVITEIRSGRDDITLFRFTRIRVYTSCYNAAYLRTKYKLNNVTGLQFNDPLRIMVKKKFYTISLIDSKHRLGAVSVLISGDFGSCFHTGNFCFHRGIAESPHLTEILSHGRGIGTLYFDNTFYEQSSTSYSFDKTIDQVVNLISKHSDNNIYVIAEKITLAPVVAEIASRAKQRFHVPEDWYPDLKLMGYGDFFTTDSKSTMIFVETKDVEKKPDNGVLIYCNRTTDLSKSPVKNKDTDSSFTFNFYDHSVHSECCKLFQFVKPEETIPIHAIDTGKIKTVSADSIIGKQSISISSDLPQKRTQSSKLSSENGCVSDAQVCSTNKRVKKTNNGSSETWLIGNGSQKINSSPIAQRHSPRKIAETNKTNNVNRPRPLCSPVGKSLQSDLSTQTPKIFVKKIETLMNPSFLNSNTSIKQKITREVEGDLSESRINGLECQNTVPSQAVSPSAPIVRRKRGIFLLKTPPRRSLDSNFLKEISKSLNSAKIKSQTSEKSVKIKIVHMRSILIRKNISCESDPHDSNVLNSPPRQLAYPLSEESSLAATESEDQKDSKLDFLYRYFNLKDFYIKGVNKDGDLNNINPNYFYSTSSGCFLPKFHGFP